MNTSKFIRKELIIWLMIVAPFSFLLIYWNQLPERIPIHWDVDGMPNGYSSKGFGIIWPLLLNVGLYFLFIFIPKIDPKKANFALFEGPYRALRLLMHTILSIAFVMGLLYAMHYPMNTKYIMTMLMPVMFMILGNFMGKIRPNYFVGIRTPWTLANEKVWVKTHRLAGRIWVIASFIDLIANILINPLPHWIFYVYVGILVGVPFIYSYVIYRDMQKTADKDLI